jgi:DNA helicase-2/ATP-dependent DNA helicase PcrA
MSNLLDGLNDEQREVVINTEGRYLVLAGAGAGKTRALTYRVAHLLKEKELMPHNIMAVTFTNKAAAEMRHRVKELIEQEGTWWIGTFHGLAVRLLVKYGRHIGVPSYFTIADEVDQKKQIKAILEQLGETGLTHEVILKIISGAKNNLLKPEDLASQGYNKKIVEIYSLYQDKLKAMNALDFDDLIFKVVEMIRHVPEVKMEVQNQFKYVIIDESQDLNTAQFELVKVISGKHGNLMLIGDCDQNIYSWRGANLNIVLEFAKEKGTKTLLLQQNYRCSANIVDASNAVIANNKNRLDKILITENKPGEPITYYLAEGEYEEACFIAGVIDNLVHYRRTHEYKDFAILYRMNSQSRVIEDILSKMFIRYRVVNGTSFYDRKEIKDAIAYIRLIVNPHDVLSFKRVANEPKRGLGDVGLAKVIDFIETNKLSVVEALDRCDEIEKVSAKARIALKQLSSVIKDFQQRSYNDEPQRLILDYMNALGYLAAIDDDDDHTRSRNICDLGEVAKEWCNASDSTEHRTNLEAFIKHLNLVSDIDAVKDDDCVKLMTSHTAKGLEFRVVFIAGLEESIFPCYIMDRSTGKPMMTDNDLEEERRLFYVSMTRAKERLYATSTIERRRFKDVYRNRPSRFINEIPKGLIRKV